MSNSTMSKVPMHIMVVLLGLIMCGAVFGMLKGREPEMVSQNDVRITYSPTKEEDVGFPYRFYVTVSSPSIQIPADGRPSPFHSFGAADGVKIYWIKGEDYKDKKDIIKKSDFSEMILTTTVQGGIFAGSLPARDRNQRYYYFFEVSDSQHNVLLTMPAQPQPRERDKLRPDGVGANVLETHKFYHVTYKQDPNTPGLMVHILLMLIAVILLIHTFYYALDYLWNPYDWIAAKSIKAMAWGVLCYGISGLPLGIWIERQKFGTYWTGFPLGWDMTDSKTLFNLVYWVIVVILMKGTIFSKDKTKDIISYRTYAWVAIIGGILLMVVRFALPHGDI